jgi:hypothetical protein
VVFIGTTEDFSKLSCGFFYFVFVFFVSLVSRQEMLLALVLVLVDLGVLEAKELDLY